MKNGLPIYKRKVNLTETADHAGSPGDHEHCGAE